MTLLKQEVKSERLFSLDFFRGLTMFLLVGEVTGLYPLLRAPELEGSWIYAIGIQLHHHPWNGLHFWDLIQPFFMFIVGVAMPISFANRIKRGQTYKKILHHTINRAFILLFLGWAIACIDAGEIVFKFQNVLAQLSVTYLLAFLVMNKSARTQILFSLGLLALTEIIYRAFPVEGFNHPFMANENFGTWLDLQYNGANLTGHWVSFNAIPTTAHTIWGVLAGLLLISDRTAKEKLKILIVAGVIGVVAGYALDPVTPIIKRIATSSFVIVTGGWTLLALAFSYWLIDMKKQKNWSLFFAIVGMNPLFIYLFANFGGGGFIENIVHPFSFAAFKWISVLTAEILTGLIVWFLMWYITYWLYKKKIFIRI
jgi:predicted acyltransferase